MVKSIKVRRKNFLPSLIISILLGLILAGIVWFTEPDGGFIIFVFFVFIFTFLFFIFALLLASSRRGLLTSVSLSLFLLLRYLGIGHLLNFLLIAGLAITVELYFSRK